MKLPMRLRETEKFKEMSNDQFNEEIKNLTPKQITDLLPNETLGTGIKIILARCLKIKNVEDASQSYTFIAKINNVLQTAKGEWELDKGGLKKLQDFLKTATENLSPIYNGQITGILEQYYAELIQKPN